MYQNAQQLNVCGCTISLFVDSCVLTKLFGGGLQCLHIADKAAVDWLMFFVVHSSIRNSTLTVNIVCRKRPVRRCVRRCLA